MKKVLLGLWLVLVLLMYGWGAIAQDATPEPTPEPVYSVYVTTQDFVSLRTGAGTDFERLTIVDPVVTLPAIGRTADTRWIQVIYNDMIGWMASRYLVWTGDVITLPVDGVNTAPFVRRAGAVAVTTRETPIYSRFVTPEDQVGTIPAGTRIELTGRLGGDGFGYFALQMRYQGQLYWIGSWNIRIVDGDYRRLLDNAYLIPYGRLIRQLETNVAESLGIYSQILGVWSRLNSGDSVSCAVIPPRARRIITEGDVLSEPVFAPPVVALDAAISSINTAIAAFETACNNPDPSFALTQEDVVAMLDELANAERNLILASSLIEPLKIRNPLLNRN
jgi:uncharacterized protein YraI